MKSNSIKYLSIYLMIFLSFILSSCSQENFDIKYKDYKVDINDFNNNLEKLNKSINKHAINLSNPIKINIWHGYYGNFQNQIKNALVSSFEFEKLNSIKNYNYQNSKSQIAWDGNDLIVLNNDYIYKFDINNNKFKNKVIINKYNCKYTFGLFIFNDNKYGHFCSNGQFTKPELRVYDNNFESLQTISLSQPIPRISNPIVDKNNNVFILTLSSILKIDKELNAKDIYINNDQLKYSGSFFFNEGIGKVGFVNNDNKIYFKSTFKNNAISYVEFDILKESFKILPIQPRTPINIMQGGSMHISNNILYYYNANGIGSFNLNSNKFNQVFNYSILSYTPIVIDKNNIFIHSTFTNKIIAINEKTNKIIWNSVPTIKQSTGNMLYANSALVAHDSEDNIIKFINAKDGTLISEHKMNAKLLSNIIIAGNKICYIDENYSIQCTK